ncbi:hypothetical protein [Tepidimonas charontis]|uniref:Uncharacterized protein n=1 Tax=Tepidimonas charontis TaxID=2267262 RepID=A0A554XHD5_9BURK|nr:hypothetical protein [Tepidimonas charontis]TSE35246.1 hypothetical protein Tchar_00857 [Tepidimonas charontis]
MTSIPPLAPLEPLLAGTLALLHYHAVRDADRPLCPYAAHKLSRNLQRLADHPAISEALAIVLHRLSRDWLQRAAVAGCAEAPDAEGPTALPPLH